MQTVTAAILIDLDFGDTSAEDQATYGPAFAAAESFWESKLTGYRDGSGLSPNNVGGHKDDISLSL